MRINIIANIFKIIKMLIYIRVSLLTKPTVSVCNMFDVSYPQFVTCALMPAGYWCKVMTAPSVNWELLARLGDTWCQHWDNPYPKISQVRTI